MSKVEVSVARAQDKGILANLAQLYIHDFSEFWAGTSDGELQDDGRFADYPLDAYWREHSRIPLLFRQDDHLIGFALFPGDWEVAVARKNLGALSFWRQAIGSHPQVRDVHEQDLTTPAWNGPLFRFVVAPA